ncbi:MAG: hypothetical protein IJ079_06810 [Lachnospiraceae bacterium]|nr:hypothetical protein [Lachnospiraceae bacterium]
MISPGLRKKLLISELQLMKETEDNQADQKTKNLLDKIHDFLVEDWKNAAME